MDRLKEIVGDAFSIVVAILRLLFLTCNMFVSSLHLIIFAQLEIVNVELRGQAWRSRRERDMRTLSFIDKLTIENPELLDIPEGELPDDFPHPNDDEENF